MEITEFAFKLLILFFPGIICAYLIDQLTIHRPREAFFFLLQAFTLGLICYFSYWVIVEIIVYFYPNSISPEITFLKALTNSNLSFSFGEIVFVSFISVILACLVSVASRYKLLNRTARYIGITKKFGELDVWGYMLNMEEVVWVTVRDHKNDLIYDGWVQSFSDDSKDAELLLRDVSIYKNSTAEKLYQVGAVYLSRKRDDISIECNTLPLDERIIWKEGLTHEQGQRNVHSSNEASEGRY
jgi:hypothetical protein